MTEKHSELGKTEGCSGFDEFPLLEAQYLSADNTCQSQPAEQAEGKEEG